MYGLMQLASGNVVVTRGRLRSSSVVAVTLLLVLFNGITMTTPVRADNPLFDTWRSFDLAEFEAKYPSDGTVADFDNDGDPDLAVVYRSQLSKLTLMFNNGDGTFGDPVHYPAEVSYGVESADLDNDGDADIVVAEWGASEQLSTISVYFNQGNGTFGTRQTHFVGRKPRSVAIADFDGDTNLDIAVGAIGTANNPIVNVAVLYNTGAGAFNSPVYFQGGDQNGLFNPLRPWALAAGDMNGDGLPDVAVGHEYQHCSVILNDGNGGFGPPSTHLVGSGPWGISNESSIVLVDAERDGDLDVLFSCIYMKLVTASEPGAVALFRNDSAGNLGAPELIALVPYSTGSADLQLADVTGDGWDDLIVGWEGGGDLGWGVVPSDGASSFAGATRYTGNERPSAVCPADLDGDLDIDLIVPADGSLAASVHLNPGDGDFSTKPVQLASGVTRDIEAGDIDNDGDEDLAMVGAYGVKVLRNSGDGTFDPPVTYPSGQYGRKVKLRDLNGDGLLDLVWADDSFSPPYDFKTRMNTGGGVFGPQTTWPVGTCGTWDLGVFDIDNDGDLDVLLAELLGCFGLLQKYIYVSKNNGDGTFAAPYEIAVPSGMFGITAGDFDEDGNLDLATTTALGINTLFGNGDGTYGTQVMLNAPEGTHDIVAVDLNGDGHVDLLGQGAHSYPSSTNGASIVVLLGNGNGTFQTLQIYRGDPSGSSGIDVGDLDADGDPDVFLSNYWANDVSVFLNRGDGTFDPQRRYGTAGTLNDVRVRDFTGDGVLDICVAATDGHNPASGAQVIPGLSGVIVGIERPRVTVPMMVAGPNPFAAQILLSYVITNPATVRLSVFDVAGRRVKTLVDADSQVGPQRVIWDATDNHGRTVSKGVYFMRLESSGRVMTKKVVFVR